jgi:hypothetical protein
MGWKGALAGAAIGGTIGALSGGKKKKRVREGTTNINRFLRSLTEKNYAQANKYLHAVISDKIKNRIRSTAN